jgi:hypothetical protein
MMTKTFLAMRARLADLPPRATVTAVRDRSQRVSTLTTKVSFAHAIAPSPSFRARAYYDETPRASYATSALGRPRLGCEYKFRVAKTMRVMQNSETSSAITSPTCEDANY